MLTKILKVFKENLYLIVPILCIALWAILCFWVKRDEIMRRGIYHSDLLAFRSIGYNIIYDPSKNYPGQWYMPNSAYFFFVAFTIWPIFVAHWLNVILNFIFAILLILEFNKILKILKIDEKIHRFLFLTIISNGWIIYWQFHINSYKILTGFLIFLILRREMQWNQENREKNLFYYLINYGLFIFILGSGPYLIYFLFIYIFYNISVKEIFKKINLKKYLIVILMFIIQNFIFFIYPYYFYVFITKGITFSTIHTYMFLLYSRVELPLTTMQLISNILSIILFIIVIIISFLPDLSIQKKFSYFSIFYILLGTFRVYFSMIFLIPLIILVYIPFYIKIDISIEFIKRNFIVLVGMFAILIYNIYPTTAYGGFLAMALIGIIISTIIILNLKTKEKRIYYIFLIIFIIAWSTFIYFMMIWFYIDYPPSSSF